MDFTFKKMTPFAEERDREDAEQCREDNAIRERIARTR